MLSHRQPEVRPGRRRVWRGAGGGAVVFGGGGGVHVGLRRVGAERRQVLLLALAGRPELEDFHAALDELIRPLGLREEVVEGERGVLREVAGRGRLPFGGGVYLDDVRRAP